MTVFVVYRRGSPLTMRVFRSRKAAQRYLETREWPRNWVLHQRRVSP